MTQLDFFLVYLLIGTLLILALGAIHNQPRHLHLPHPTTKYWLYAVVTWPIVLIFYVVGVVQIARGKR